MFLQTFITPPKHNRKSIKISEQANIFKIHDNAEEGHHHKSSTIINIIMNYIRFLFRYIVIDKIVFI
jgi:hypothetical protein